MFDAYHLWLFLHIVGAIVAFGFGFTAPVFGSHLSKAPQHANWYIGAVKSVADRVIIPAALSMAVTGVLLVMSTSRRFEETWLAAAIVIYVIAIAVVLLVQRPTMVRLIGLTSTPPGPGGPSPEVPALAARLRLVGIGLTIAVTVIVFLMVFKPGA